MDFHRDRLAFIKGLKWCRDLQFRVRSLALLLPSVAKEIGNASPSTAKSTTEEPI
jgi:hypothetical protein